MNTLKATNIKASSSRTKRRSGAQIAELPPSLLIIFFFFFFPALNLIYLTFAFGAGWYLNNIELRSVACRRAVSIGLPFPPTGAYTAVTDLPESINWKGLMGVTESSSPEVAQIPLATNPNSVGTSTVKTTVSIRPLFVLPLLANLPIASQIPGLGKPLQLTYYGSIQQEDQGP